MIQEITKILYEDILSQMTNNDSTIITLKCKEHGEFNISIKEILESENGILCPKCLSDKNILKRLNNFRNFLLKARKIHGDKYNYDKVCYKKGHEKVEIICPIHGSFLQTPSSHLSGRGCKKCAGLDKLTTEEFIERAIKVHGDRYDYSKTKYVNHRTKVIITCKEHGDFT